jgi:Putative auto-transporter adhesin, head GIN domain
MRQLLTAAALVLVAACSVGATGSSGAALAGTPIQGSGDNGRRAFNDVGTFSQIDLAGPYNVVVQVSGAPSIRAEGDESALQQLEVRLDNGTLRIGTRPGNWTASGRATVYVTAASLDGVGISGSGDMQVGPLRAAQFRSSVAGSGNLTLARLDSDRAQFSIAGSGNLQAEGHAREASLNVAGSGDGRLGGFEVESATVSVAGSGNAALRATRSAEVRVAGSGDVEVSGGAHCSVHASGSGQIRCG